MANKFSATIATYNNYAQQFGNHFERKLDTKELTAFLALLPEDSYLLDAGCGSARDAAYFMKQGHRVLGVDISEGLLAEAARRHPEVETRQMSLTDLKFSDDTFDGVWCKAALLHIDRTEVPGVLENFYRILKPGGILFVQTKMGDGEGEQPAVFDSTVTRHFVFYGLEEMKHLIENAGFSVISAYNFNGQKRHENSRDQEWLNVFAKK